MTGRATPSRDETISEHVRPRPAGPLPNAVRRIGAVAFVFFLVKGLLWLGLFGLGAAGLMGL